MVRLRGSERSEQRELMILAEVLDGCSSSRSSVRNLTTDRDCLRRSRQSQRESRRRQLARRHACGSFGGYVSLPSLTGNQPRSHVNNSSGFLLQLSKSETEIQTTLARGSPLASEPSFLVRADFAAVARLSVTKKFAKDLPVLVLGRSLGSFRTTPRERALSRPSRWLLLSSSRTLRASLAFVLKGANQVVLLQPELLRRQRRARSFLLRWRTSSRAFTFQAFAPSTMLMPPPDLHTLHLSSQASWGVL